MIRYFYPNTRVGHLKGELHHVLINRNIMLCKKFAAAPPHSSKRETLISFRAVSATVVWPAIFVAVT